MLDSPVDDVFAGALGVGVLEARGRLCEGTGFGGVGVAPDEDFFGGIVVDGEIEVVILRADARFEYSKET